MRARQPHTQQLRRAIWSALALGSQGKSRSTHSRQAGARLIPVLRLEIKSAICCLLVNKHKEKEQEGKRVRYCGKSRAFVLGETRLGLASQLVVVVGLNPMRRPQKAERSNWNGPDRATSCLLILAMVAVIRLRRRVAGLGPISQSCGPNVDEDDNN